MEISHIALLFAVGTAAGFINVNAGGGSSISVPVLIFLGLDAAVANGTNRVAIIIQNLFATASFQKNKLHNHPLSLKLALFTLPGSILGSIAATRVSNILFQRILGAVLIFIVISMFFSRSYAGKNKEENTPTNWLIYPALIGIGFYGGFLQVGVGFLFMAALYHLLHLDLVKVNMHKVIIIFIYTIPALLVFTLTGNVNWVYGLILAVGTAFGGWWGAHVSVRGGERAIRAVLAGAIIIMAFKLFGLY
ncbi:MAG: sulfite exporter TauE/SafE family protein [Candidatus Aminicenantes bacterium]|nr:sulfite exporter TauE/SafE family protein [Candidatus Aminicenantes bacterium]